MVLAGGRRACRGFSVSHFRKSSSDLPAPGWLSICPGRVTCPFAEPLVAEPVAAERDAFGFRGPPLRPAELE